MKKAHLNVFMIFLLAASLSGCAALTIVGVSRQALHKRLKKRDSGKAEQEG